MSDISKWESIVGTRVQGILDMIKAPTYLIVHKLDFMHAIWAELIKLIQKYGKNRMLLVAYIYGILLPLKRHFSGKEPQTFINRINSKERMEAAIERIVNRQWEKDVRTQGKLRQSIPMCAMKNYNGNAVGKGLRIPGTIRYWCMTCKKFVGFTEEDYWKHQESVHNNSEVREWDYIVRKYKF
jgi:hypothetical protein